MARLSRKYKADENFAFREGLNLKKNVFFFMVFHGSRLVFHGSRSVFMVFQGSRFVLHGSRWDLRLNHGSRFVFIVTGRFL